MSPSVSRRSFMRFGAGLTVAAGLSTARAADSSRKPRTGAPVRVAMIGVGGRGSHLLGHVLGVPGAGGGGDTREHFVNFFDAVRSGDPKATYCGIENGVGASYIGLLIRQSLEAGRKVTLEETLADTRRPPVPAA